MAGDLRFDHALIAVTDLAAARADYESLGFTVFYGGKHADGRTENCLIVFQDGGYLELIALTDPNDVLEPGGMHAGLFGPGEGLAGYALLSTDLGADTAAMRERGLDMVGPLENSRLRPDGARVAWAAAVITDMPNPFFLEDLTPRELRVPPEKAVHPNGSTGVTRLVVAVPDLETAIGRYTKIFGTEPTPASDVGEARAVDLVGGPTVVTLAQPDSGDSPLHAQLRARGDSPYSILLTGSESIGELDTTLLHGARIEIASWSPGRAG